MELVIDRFEDEGIVVLERPDGASFSIPRTWLPAGAVEGDVLTVRVTTLDEADSAAGIEIMRNPGATRERLEQARALRDRIPRAGEGDIAL